jgi:hypothetical protein
MSIEALIAQLTGATNPIYGPDTKGGQRRLFHPGPTIGNPELRERGQLIRNNLAVEVYPSLRGEAINRILTRAEGLPQGTEHKVLRRVLRADDFIPADLGAGLDFRNQEAAAGAARGAVHRELMASGLTNNELRAALRDGSGYPGVELTFKPPAGMGGSYQPPWNGRGALIDIHQTGVPDNWKRTLMHEIGHSADPNFDIRDSKGLGPTDRFANAARDYRAANNIGLASADEVAAAHDRLLDAGRDVARWHGEREGFADHTAYHKAQPNAPRRYSVYPAEVALGRYQKLLPGQQIPLEMTQQFERSWLGKLAAERPPGSDLRVRQLHGWRSLGVPVRHGLMPDPPTQQQFRGMPRDAGFLKVAKPKIQPRAAALGMFAPMAAELAANHIPNQDVASTVRAGGMGGGLGSIFGPRGALVGAGLGMVADFLSRQR